MQLFLIRLLQFHQCEICYSDRELDRGDREVWGSVGDNQIGIIHSAAMPVKYSYDTVLDNAANNKQVRSQTFDPYISAEAVFAKGVTLSTSLLPTCWIL